MAKGRKTSADLPVKVPASKSIDLDQSEPVQAIAIPYVYLMTPFDT